MKKVLLAVVVIAVTILAWPGSASDSPATAEQTKKNRANPRIGIFGAIDGEGGEVPFPFGNEAKFPWETIEGTYHAQSEDYEAYFSFQVEQGNNGQPFLKVLHYENRYGTLFGEGGGFTQTDNRIVRAAMRGRNGLSYMVFVRSFNDVEINGNHIRKATVLTIRSFGDSERKDWHFLLKKVSSRPLYAR